MSYLGKQISKALNYQVLGKKKPAAKPAKKPAPKPKVTYKSTPKPTAPKNKIKPATVSTKPSPKRVRPPTAPKNQGIARKMAKKASKTVALKRKINKLENKAFKKTRG